MEDINSEEDEFRDNKQRAEDWNDKVFKNTGYKLKSRKNDFFWKFMVVLFFLLFVGSLYLVYEERIKLFTSNTTNNNQYNITNSISSPISNAYDTKNYNNFTIVVNLNNTIINQNSS